MIIDHGADRQGLLSPGIRNVNKAEDHSLIDLPESCTDGSATNMSTSPVEKTQIEDEVVNSPENEAATTAASIDSDDDDDESYLDHSDLDEVSVMPVPISKARLEREARHAKIHEVMDEDDKNCMSDQDENDNQALPPRHSAAVNSGDESAMIIDKARDYQQELFERAKAENVLAVLDTGSGKTLIACLLIKHVLAQETIAREEGQPPRTVFFLVNSIHLVIQQGEVLANNLSESPAVLYGNIKEDLWKRDVWSEILAIKRVIVCTAEVLRQALSHNHISMNAISLLIFDECHHAKKGHPYAKIMLDFYLPCSGQCRPKIFGMTASPVHTKSNMMKASGDLETLLHSKIVTTASMSLLEHAPRAKNEIWTYERPRHAVDTQLTAQIKASCNIEELHQPLQFAHDATSILGTWAADQLWSYVFSENEAKSLVKRYEQSEAYQQIETSEERQKNIDALNKMALLINHLDFKYKFGQKPDLDSEDLSSKVVVLARQLQRRYCENDSLRTIVFVEQRLTAELLADLFAKFRFENLRPGVLLGSNQASRTYGPSPILLESNRGSRTHGPQGTQSNKQQTVMKDFRTGWINCIFATNVAEEGIDIPQCSLVVRFDLFKTTIQYMQSRGRARMKDSVYAMMVEKDNEDQLNEIQYAEDFDEYIKLFCSKLPPDRILDTTDSRLRRMIEKHAAGHEFETPSGARCSYNESLVILSRYASSLHYTGEITTVVHYELDCKNGQFRYAVRLADGTKSLGREKIRGLWMANKSLAKRSAAFWACYELRGRKLLDDNLDSIHVRTQHKNNNAKWAVDKKKEKYEMKIKPDFWRRGSATSAELYATIVRLVPSRELKHKLSPFVLFSRDPLPEIPRFPVYLEDNISTEVVFEHIPTEMLVTPKQVDYLTAYTLRSVFDDVFHKKYGHNPDAMSYWLAPFNEAVYQKTGVPEFEQMINVPELQVALNERVSWEPGMADTLWSHKFLIDKWTGAFRYISHDVVPGATINSPVPESATVIGRKSKRNVEEFTNSLWKKSRERNAENVDLHQPVFDCEVFQARRDFLDDANAKEIAKNGIHCHTVPQPLEVGRLLPAMAASLMVWPSILHRLESYLITLEAFAKLGLHVPADLALEAFTATGDNDDDGEQTHSKSLRGMGKNYERLEFIGDSLLKMTTTITTFCIKDKAAESDLHCDRMQMLCNNNLFLVSTEESLKLYQYARTNGFSRTTWYPEGLVQHRGRGVKADPLPVEHEKVHQDLGKKTIADISEAIIGAAYQAGRTLPDRFDMGLKAITQLVCDDLHPVNKWSDIAPLYKPQSWQLQTNDPLAVDVANKVEGSVGIGYHFKHPRLLRSAMTHASDVNSPVPDYQRLEFLGDAVLDMVSISWMFNKYEDKNPQWLTEHKMAMVSNKFLAALAVTLDFDKLMIANNVALQGHVSDYAKRVREVWDQGKDNINRDFWIEIENEPKSLSDLVESFVGALMVDSAFDYTLVERFFEKHILWFFEDLDLYAGFANRHPTTYLYQKLTDEFKCSNYAVDCVEREVSTGIEIGAAVFIHGDLIVKSTGASSKYARVRVSKKALQRLEGLKIKDFRKQFHCDCKRKAELSAELDKEKTAEAENEK